MIYSLGNAPGAACVMLSHYDPLSLSCVCICGGRRIWARMNKRRFIINLNGIYRAVRHVLAETPSVSSSLSLSLCAQLYSFQRPTAHNAHLNPHKIQSAAGAALARQTKAIPYLTPAQKGLSKCLIQIFGPLWCAALSLCAANMVYIYTHVRLSIINKRIKNSFIFSTSAI